MQKVRYHKHIIIKLILSDYKHQISRVNKHFPSRYYIRYRSIQVSLLPKRSSDLRSNLSWFDLLILFLNHSLTGLYLPSLDLKEYK